MRVSVLLLLVLACASATAQTVVPNTFLPGTPAKAADVNANFQALASAINALAARVDKLEGKLVQADLAGSYALQAFQSEFNGGDFGRVANYVNTGTVTLNADGSGTLTATEAGSRLFLSQDGTGKLKGTSSTYVNPTETQTFTWTYANNVITALNGTLVVTAGGKLLIRASTNPTDFTQVIVLLTKK